MGPRVRKTGSLRKVRARAESNHRDQARWSTTLTRGREAAHTLLTTASFRQIGRKMGVTPPGRYLVLRRDGNSSMVTLPTSNTDGRHSSKAANATATSRTAYTNRQSHENLAIPIVHAACPSPLAPDARAQTPLQERVAWWRPDAGAGQSTVLVGRASSNCRLDCDSSDGSAAWLQVLLTACSCPYSNNELSSTLFNRVCDNVFTLPQNYLLLVLEK